MYSTVFLVYRMGLWMPPSNRRRGLGSSSLDRRQQWGLHSLFACRKHVLSYWTEFVSIVLLNAPIAPLFHCHLAVYWICLLQSRRRRRRRANKTALHNGANAAVAVVALMFALVSRRQPTTSNKLRLSPRLREAERRSWKKKKKKKTNN